MILEALLEVVIDVLIQLPFAVLRHAWQHDFPDPPAAPEQVNAVEPALDPDPVLSLWDRDLDGP